MDESDAMSEDVTQRRALPLRLACRCSLFFPLLAEVGAPSSDDVDTATPMIDDTKACCLHSMLVASVGRYRTAALEADILVIGTDVVEHVLR